MAKLHDAVAYNLFQFEMNRLSKITYKGYKTTDVQTTSFQVYYKWTDDQTLSQPDNNIYPYETGDMINLIDEDHGGSFFTAGAKFHLVSSLSGLVSFGVFLPRKAAKNTVCF